MVTGDAKAQQWKQYADPAHAGWSAEALDEAREFAAKGGSGAVLIVDSGNVVAAWGSIDHPFKAASMRKSVYDAVFGASFLKKPFDLSETIGSLGIDDLGKLSEGEKKATVEQLMEARSGVYHPAAYETRSNAERRPDRGSARPGEQWYYNNWDFNVLTAVYKRLTGTDFEDALETGLVDVIGFEDYKRTHAFRWLEPETSKFPALTLRVSARDLARIGVLYLQLGKWDGKQIIDPEWIKASTKSHTVFKDDHYRGEGNGYGRLWWTYPARPESGSQYASYRRIAARGAGGQMMVLFPEIDVVVVHLADTDAGEGVSDAYVGELMDRILSARSGPRQGRQVLGAVRKEKLSDTAPLPIENLSPVPAGMLAKVTGIYMFDEKRGIKLYAFEGRLFGRTVGIPLPDVELFVAHDGSFRSPVASVKIEQGPVSGGRVGEVTMSFAGRSAVAKRSAE